MGKFKSFLINEQIGLADLDSRIEKASKRQDLGDQIGGALTHPAWSTSDTSFNPASTSGVDISVPSVERIGKITHLMLKKNPIYVRLSDGTECNFSYDQFRKIQGNPEVGKTMSISFQRHPEDAVQQHSKIDKAMVLD